MNKRDGITAQFIRLLVFAGLGSLLLFATSRLAFRFALTAYVDQTNFIQRETARQLEEFQTFVTEENLSSKDVRPITDWVQKHNLTLLELYRDHVLVYSSFAPGREIKGEQDQRVPFYDWQPYATIHFADGDFEALLYCNTIRTYELLGTTVLLIFCLGLSLTVYEPYIRRILDNITSNILKYADPAYPVSVTFVREEDAGLAFANVTLSDTDSVESTKVGLVSIQTMMEKMHADSRAESDGRRFCITLLFPVNS